MIGTRPYQLRHRSGYTTGHIGVISIDENVIEIKKHRSVKKIQLHVRHNKNEIHVFICLYITFQVTKYLFIS